MRVMVADCIFDFFLKFFVLLPAASIKLPEA
jgi:hypothetical protein